MTRIVFILNALITIAFAVPTLVAPSAMFAGFGVVLDAGGETVARGYASACLGYGLVFALLNATREPGTISSLLLASLAFNAVEVAIQLTGYVQGGVSSAVFVTVAAHAVLTALTVLAIRRRAAWG